jgi:hypothetical protein
MAGSTVVGGSVGEGNPGSRQGNPRLSEAAGVVMMGTKTSATAIFGDAGHRDDFRIVHIHEAMNDKEKSMHRLSGSGIP